MTGIQLDLFAPLGETPYGAGELAKLLHVQQDQLETLLYALAAGLLYVCDGRFANGEETDRRLMRGRSVFIGVKHLYVVALFCGGLANGRECAQRSSGGAGHFSARDDGEYAELLCVLHPGAKNLGRSV